MVRLLKCSSMSHQPTAIFAYMQIFIYFVIIITCLYYYLFKDTYNVHEIYSTHILTDVCVCMFSCE